MSLLAEKVAKIKFNRIWSMPSRHTFTIKPIRELLARYIQQQQQQQVWIDPFAGYNSPATITNDLNPKCPTDYHLEAIDFLQVIKERKETVYGVLLDPPYSPRQVKECYEGLGLKVTQSATNKQFWTKTRKFIAQEFKPKVVISCGWNSQGLGKNLGYSIIEILLVAHGGSRNDTIVTVEQPIEEVRQT